MYCHEELPEILSEIDNNLYELKDINDNEDDSLNEESNIEDIITNIEDAQESSAIKADNNEKELNKYEQCAVNSNEAHSLNEEFTNKRPCGFSLLDKSVEVKEWKSMLIETCNILAEIDPQIILDCCNDPNMNGRKAIYFARYQVPTMKAPRKLDNLDLYLETNLSANGIRNLIIKMLDRYGITMDEFKIYLRTDYIRLH